MYSYYQYSPSVAAAITVSVLYSLSFIVTAAQCLRYKCWVWITMVVAVGMEAAGYITRSVSSQNVENKHLYVAQYCLIVLAPVLMAAACYVIFGRIVFHVVPPEARTLKLLWISPRWITLIFVISDIIALILQLVGAVIITSVDPTNSDATQKADQGRTIAQIGVAVQLVGFGLFTVIALRFNFVAKRFTSQFESRISPVDEKYVTVDRAERKVRKNWSAILHVTNAACACILIRSVYRMVDFSEGRTGYTETHEWCIYVFDTLPIFLVVAMFIWWHPAKYLPYLGFRLPKANR